MSSTEVEIRNGRIVMERHRLRSVLVLSLLDAGRPLTVRDLVEAIHEQGFTSLGRPSKTVSDALRAEVARGRVRRLGRGVYVAGTVAKVTKHRMRRRVAEVPERSIEAVATNRSL